MLCYIQETVVWYNTAVFSIHHLYTQLVLLHFTNFSLPYTKRKGKRKLSQHRFTKIRLVVISHQRGPFFSSRFMDALIHRMTSRLLKTQ